MVAELEDCLSYTPSNRLEFLHQGHRAQYEDRAVVLRFPQDA